MFPTFTTCLITQDLLSKDCVDPPIKRQYKGYEWICDDCNEADSQDDYDDDETAHKSWVPTERPCQNWLGKIYIRINK